MPRTVDTGRRHIKGLGASRRKPIICRRLAPPRLSASGLKTLAGIIAVAALTMGPPPARGASPPVTIGGPFVLRAPDGTTVTDQAYRGKWLLVYFGYTFCPDTCPTTLVEIAAALAKLGPAAARLQPIFITVDPERDTPQVMGNYVQSFDPRIIGLTGDAQQIAAVAEEYGAYFARRTIGPGAGGYLMDHSTYIYVMDPHGTFVRAFDADTSADRIADGLRPLIAQPGG